MSVRPATASSGRLRAYLEFILAVVFYFTAQSVPLAQAVLDEVSRATGLTPRGVTQARFEVLVDDAKIPAILVETAFVTNTHEEQMLGDPQQQQMFAQGIFKGLQRYLAAQQSAAP